MRPRHPQTVLRPATPARGVTLVELIVFIVIAAIVAVAMLQAFSGTMRGSYYGKELTQGTQLAQQRMEVIRAQRKTLGYSAFISSPNYDPCQSGAWTGQLCTSTSSYSVKSTPPVANACGTGCTPVTVTVTGPFGDQLAQLAYNFWNY